MSRRDPQRARALALWTAGWLAAFLVAGMLWLGEPTLQWPVLAVPLLWALVALRPRRRPAGDDRWDEDPWGSDDWPPEQPPGIGHRTDTVERPAVRPPRD